MKRPIFTLALLIFSLFPLLAQQQPGIFCGQDILRDIWKTQYPEYTAAVDATYQWANAPQAQPRGTLTIPVVIHVVWRNPEENLSDELIQSQIDVLNQDFNRMNPDTGNLRTIFQDVAGAADIHFEVAAVNRVQTSINFSVNILSGTLAPEVKSTALGGSDAWDTEKYLNIWICKIQPITIGPIVLGQILGFAFPPAGLPNWPEGTNAPNSSEDGVVIDFRVWGVNNPNPISVPGASGNLVVQGRTPTHEVGHYLGLRHIWGDGGTFGPNDCNQSDGVEDTPHANAQSDFNCDKTRNTCVKVEPFYGMDMPDLVENYMDYSSEDCMNMFTKGQVQIMRNVLAGPRQGLVEGSTALKPVASTANWRLQPNPARGETSIVLDQPGDSDTQIRIVDQAGRIVLEERLPAGSVRYDLNIRQLGRGLYVVVCSNARGISQQKLVVAQ